MPRWGITLHPPHTMPSCRQTASGWVCDVPIPTPFEQACQTVTNYKPWLLGCTWICFIVCMVYAIIIGDWFYANIGIAPLFLAMIFVYGRQSEYQALVFMIFAIKLIILASYLLFFGIRDGMSYIEYYPSIDIAMHLLMGAYLYFAAASLFPHTHFLIKLLGALLFEVVYELAEQGFGAFILNLTPEERIALGWSLDNVIQDGLCNLFGGVLMAAVDIFCVRRFASVTMTIPKVSPTTSY